MARVCIFIAPASFTPLILQPSFTEPAGYTGKAVVAGHRCSIYTDVLTLLDFAAQLRQGDASGERTQGFVEKQDKDFVPSDEAKSIPENYDGPATRTRATSDSPPDPYTTEVPEPPSDM